ncbi:MIZ zinc finger protein (macronuclear) [Tetrahymena thermophila SB210]|uniref:MIZ zinc finger protein n=1 Tax=Tetrahymena thermophila (strain SB210) TaxID=312017 RepID=W7XL92_TETTS|nr:MIZ zinc finger protein [Tetrahymena thermophila SB210]EWS75884.1 MIZ zinc finger protein [Tetrahymena thermophila SB210]|eukprot:XP_012651587.1 MIZ zinc finger protein [Tetrahymena thermophila SB210]
MSDPLNDMLIEDQQQFNLICYNSLVPLYSPYYFHNHNMVVYNEDQLEIIKKKLVDHYQIHQNCMIDEECQIDFSSLEFLKPKKQLAFQELLNQRVLNTSHQEYIQLEDNHSCGNTDTQYFYNNKIYLPFKEDEYEMTDSMISQNPQIFQMLNDEFIAAHLYWQNIFQFMANDVDLTEDQHFELQKNYKNKNFYNLCLLTGDIVLIPIRLNGCNHLECFDLNSIYRFIVKQKTATIQCPLCRHEANFFEEKDSFYLDKKLLKVINKNTSYSPVWKFISDEFGMQDILRSNTKLDISKSNKVFWKSKKDENYIIQLKQHYQNFVGRLIQNCSQNSIYPIPVRCIKCFDLTKYCDLAQQLLTPDQCLCCNQQLSCNNDGFLDELRIDFILLNEITKYAQLTIQSFFVLGHNNGQVFLQASYQDLTGKIQKVSDNSYIQNALVIRLDMFTGQRIQGLPIRWKDCNHTNCIDLNNYCNQELPRYCLMCNKTYELTDLVWDEVIFNSLQYLPQNDNLYYDYNSKQYVLSDIQLSQSSVKAQGFQANQFAQNKNVEPSLDNQKSPSNTQNNINSGARYNNFMEGPTTMPTNFKQMNVTQGYQDQSNQEQNIYKNRTDGYQNIDQSKQNFTQTQGLKQQQNQVPDVRDNNVQNKPGQQQNAFKKTLQDDCYANAFKNGVQKYHQMFNLKPNTCQTYQFQNNSPADQADPSIIGQNNLNTFSQSSQNMFQQQGQGFQNQQQQLNLNNNQFQQQFTNNQQPVVMQDTFDINQSANPLQQVYQQQYQNHPQGQPITFQNVSFQQNQTHIPQPQIIPGQLINQSVQQNEQRSAQFQQNQYSFQANFPDANNINLNNYNQFNTAQFNPNQMSYPNQIQNQMPQAFQNQIVNPFIPSYYDINQQFVPFARSNRQVQQRDNYIANNVINNPSYYQQPDNIRVSIQPQQVQQNQQQPQQSQPIQVREINKNGKTIIFKQVTKK